MKFIVKLLLLITLGLIAINASKSKLRNKRKNHYKFKPDQNSLANKKAIEENNKNNNNDNPNFKGLNVRQK